ncbi:MAG: hypothetical protein JRH20_29630, partial [Deltaproteobacteria bacterium]|nr:hypothetical protein [Deltaproteobacteria bacterium]
MKHDSTVVVVTGQRLAELLRATRNSFLHVLRLQPVSESYLGQSMFIIEEYAQFCEQQAPAHPWLLRKQYLAQRADLRAKHSYSASYLDTEGRQLCHFLRWYAAQVYAGDVSWGELSPEQLDAYWATQPAALSYRRTILSRHLQPLLLWLNQRPFKPSHKLEPLLHDYFEERRLALRGNDYGFVLTHRAKIVTRRHLVWLEQQGHLPAGTATQGAAWSGVAKVGATVAKHGKGDSQALLEYFEVKVDSDLPHPLRQPLVEYVAHLISERELVKSSIESSLRTNQALCRKLVEEGCNSFAQLRVSHLDDVVSSLLCAAQHDVQRRRQQVQAQHSRL